MLGKVKRPAEEARRKEKMKTQILSSISPYEVLGLDANSTHSSRDVESAFYKAYSPLGIGLRDSDTEAAILRLEKARRFLLDATSVAAYTKCSDYFDQMKEFSARQNNPRNDLIVAEMTRRIEELEDEVNEKYVVEVSDLQDDINTKCKQIAKLENILTKKRKEIVDKTSTIVRLENDVSNLIRSNQEFIENRSICMQREETKIKRISIENSQLKHELQEVRCQRQELATSGATRIQEMELEVKELRDRNTELEIKYKKMKCHLESEISKRTARTEELEENLLQVNATIQELQSKLRSVPEKTQIKLSTLESENADLRRTYDQLTSTMEQRKLEHIDSIDRLNQEGLKLKKQCKDLEIAVKIEIGNKDSIIQSLEVERSSLKHKFQEIECNVKAYLDKRHATVNKLKVMCSDLQHIEQELNLEVVETSYNELSSLGLGESIHTHLSDIHPTGGSFCRREATIARKVSPKTCNAVDIAASSTANKGSKPGKLVLYSTADRKKLVSVEKKSSTCKNAHAFTKPASFKGILGSKEGSQSVNANITKHQRWANRIKQNEPDRLKCTHCNKRFSTTCNLKRHVKSNHMAVGSS